MDACQGSISNYERKKQALISVNIWKSNFISLWKKFGSFETVDGVEVFDGYRIDGDGEGQKRMSKHLKAKDMWEKTQHDDIASVKLWFNLNKLLQIKQEHIDAWLVDVKGNLDQADFDVLKYEILDDDVVSHGFYKQTKDADGNVTSETLVTDVFYEDISSYISQKKLYNLLETNNATSFNYDQVLTVVQVENLLDAVVTKHSIVDGASAFDVDEVEEAIQNYMSKEGVGTEILDDLVTDGTAITFGVQGADKKYYLPLESAKKMSGFVFVELVTKTLDFRIKKKGGFWRALKRFAKLILAGIASYFQQYWLAASLLVGFVADETGIKALRIVSQVLGLMEGDITSLSNMGISEGLNLLLELYGIYMTLKFNPDSGTEKVEDTKDSQGLYYQAPYDAYDDIYCYDDLITVRHDEPIK